MASGPFELFETDTNVEVSGIDIDYDSFYVTIARAGGSNTKFEKAMALVAKKNSFKIENELLEGDDAVSILLPVYADTVILGWGSKQYGEGSVPDRDGSELKFSRENVIYLLTELPALFADLQRKSRQMALFRKHAVEGQAKN